MKEKRHLIISVLVTVFLLPFSISCYAGSVDAEREFERLRSNPPALRNFIYRFPKGADLHNHIDGAIYAERFIAWGAEDGKCIHLQTYVISLPPCGNEQVKLSDVQYNADIVNRIIDAFSTRNYERRPVSGHNQFFSTFRRFTVATLGREGDMIAAASARAAKQGISYIELMQSYGMFAAREMAKDKQKFDASQAIATLVNNQAIEKLAKATIQKTNTVEQQWRDTLNCDSRQADAACDVTVRYLAQVIRVFPKEQVLAQTLLAFKLIEIDPRYVGLNFVAPEDNPVSLRDHTWQMQIIGEIGKHIPVAKRGITLHAGELSLGLVPPEYLGRHIREAIEIAGARRIGHGIDILHDPKASTLMEYMAKNNIMVEINLTSNETILGVHGDDHPFRSYREHGVPLALSTDDEGVSRIDLTHEYKRAVLTYDLSYNDIKELSRNSLAYSFLAGEGLLTDIAAVKYVRECAAEKPGGEIHSKACKSFLRENEKARLQWQLEEQFVEFEAGF